MEAAEVITEREAVAEVVAPSGPASPDRSRGRWLPPLLLLPLLPQEEVDEESLDCGEGGVKSGLEEWWPAALRRRALKPVGASKTDCLRRGRVRSCDCSGEEEEAIKDEDEGEDEEVIK